MCDEAPTPTSSTTPTSSNAITSSTATPTPEFTVPLWTFTEFGSVSSKSL